TCNCAMPRSKPKDFEQPLICRREHPDYGLRSAIGAGSLRSDVQFLFGDYVLDVSRRELRRGRDLIAMEPQGFDLLVYLVRNRDRVVSRDDLVGAVWGGRIVSESTLTSRISAARKAVGDSGEQQNLIRTIARKGIRFVGAAVESASSENALVGTTTSSA